MRCLSVSLFLIAILAINFYPVFFENKTLTCDAQSTHVFDGGGPYWQIEPSIYLNNYYIFSRVLPLWNPYNATGIPLMATTYPSSYSLLNMFAFLFPSQLTLDISALFRIFLSGLTLYFFLRLWRISVLTTFVGAVYYMLSVHNVWCIQQFQMHTIAVAPAILLFLERTVRYGRKSDFAFSVFFMSMAVLGGNPEEIILTVILAASYYFYRSRKVLQLKGFAIFLSAFGLTAFFTIPAIEFFLHAEVAPRLLDADFSKYCSNFPYKLVFVLNIIMFLLIFVGIIRGRKLNSGSLRYFFFSYIILFLCFLYKVPIISWLSKVYPFSHIWWGKYRATLYLSIGILGAIGLDAIRGKNPFRCIIYYVICIMILLAIFFYIPRTYPDRVKDLYKSPALKFLTNKLENGDFFRVLPNGIRHILEPNRNCIYKIPILGYSGPLQEKRYYDFVRYIFGYPPEEHPEKTVFEKDRFLNLLGVKYLYSNRGVLLFGNEDELIFDKLKFKTARDIQQQFLNLDGSIKKSVILFQDEEAILKVAVQEGNILKFSISPDPFYLNQGYNDGITFFIDAISGGKGFSLFRKHLDVLNNPDHQKWQDYSIDLSRFRGDNIRLSFRIKAEKPGVWANIMLVSKIDSYVDIEDENWKLVFCDNINGDVIYENKDAFERVYIVHRAEAASRENVLKILSNPDFDLKNKILVEKKLPEEVLNCKGAPLEDNSTGKIMEYSPNRILIEVDIENDGFLVLSDTYYPGWKVYVDRKEKEILAANYLMRALYLERGSHTVEFRYTPLTFRLGSAIGILTLFLLIIYLIL